ncbi:MAG: reverse transcriptase family protein [Rikenellaceae bacterium]
MLYNPEDIGNTKMLSGILHCSEDIILRLQFPVVLCQPPTHNRDSNIVVIHRIPKRRVHNEYRVVYNVYFEEYSNAYKCLKYYLYDLYSPHRAIHGFIPTRNIASNAQQHITKKNITNIDIKDFFGSISIEKVKSTFIRYNFIDDVADILSKIVTLNERLVAGYATSPIIANMYCDLMDNEIQEICDSNDVTYTRYADDITLSGDKIDILEQVKSILSKYGFEINDRKTRLYHKGQGQYVTGLSVEDCLMPRIPKYIKRKIQQEIYYISKYGIRSVLAFKSTSKDKYLEDKLEYEVEFDEVDIKSKAAKIIGWIAYAQSIEPEFALKCKKQLLKTKHNESIKCLCLAQGFIDEKSGIRINLDKVFIDDKL